MPAFINRFSQENGWSQETVQWSGSEAVKILISAIGNPQSKILFVECDETDVFTYVRQLEVPECLADSADKAEMSERLNAIVNKLHPEDIEDFDTQYVFHGTAYEAGISQGGVIAVSSIVHFHYASLNQYPNYDNLPWA